MIIDRNDSKISISDIEDLSKYPKDTIVVLDEPPPDLPVPDFNKKEKKRMI